MIRRLASQATKFVVLSAAASFVLLAAIGSAFGQGSIEQQLQRAVDAYKQAESTSGRSERIEGFRRAELLFSGLAEERDVRSPELLVNLGNAALRAEHLGSAILAFHRALQLDPDHQRAKQNLIYARSLLPEWVPRPEDDALLNSFFAWATHLTASELSSLASVAFLIATLLIAAGIRLRRAGLVNLSIVPGLVWLALLAAVLALSSHGRDELAVVIVTEVNAKSSDSVNSPNRLPQALPDGTEVRIVESRKDWAQVRLADGRDVWLPSSAIKKLQQSAAP